MAKLMVLAMRLLIVIAALVLQTTPALAKRRHPPRNIDLFARRALAPVAYDAAYDQALASPGYLHSYVGASTAAAQPALLMFRDPLYPIYARTGSADLTGLAVSLASSYAPTLVPTLDRAPLLPIPTMTAGAYGVSLWGRIR